MHWSGNWVLEKLGLEQQREHPVIYKGVKVGESFIPDLIVDSARLFV